MPRQISVPMVLVSKPQFRWRPRKSGQEDVMIYLTAMVMYRGGDAYTLDGPVAVNVDAIEYVFGVKQDDGRISTMVSTVDMELEVAETQKKVTDAVARARGLRNACLCGPAKKE